MASEAGTHLVSLVRESYAPAPSLAAWVDALSAHVACHFEGAHGVVTRLYDVETRSTLGPYSVHVQDERVGRALREHESSSLHRMDFLLGGSPGFRSMRQNLARSFGDDAYTNGMLARFRSLGVEDMLHLTAFDGERIWLTVGVLTRVQEPSIRSARSWSMVASHFATALRLQRRCDESADALDADTLVFDERLRPVHAEGEGKTKSTRERLREAVRHIDAMRRDTGEDERALAVWRGLLEGTWSIVDRHDADGRRFIVAVPNATMPRAEPILSKREAQITALATEGYSDKWIAYTLGLGRSTVAVHLRSALSKLGLPSRMALVRSFGRKVSPDEHT